MWKLKSVSDDKNKNRKTLLLVENKELSAHVGACS